MLSVSDMHASAAASLMAAESDVKPLAQSIENKARMTNKQDRTDLM